MNVCRSIMNEDQNAVNKVHFSFHENPQVFEKHTLMHKEYFVP